VLASEPDEPRKGRCTKEKIAADGKRHRCDKKEKHDDNVHACKCAKAFEQIAALELFPPQTRLATEPAARTNSRVNPG
jgi:hypothetical protein